MSALQFLLLEANLPDVEVVQATLREGGIDCELLRVDTRAAFIRALESNAIDLILADYALSNFDEIAALTIARRLRPEIPFIFISGSLGEELAIAAIKQGATDYVLKQRLGRLVPSVQRALQEAQELDKDITKRKQAEAAIESDLKDTQLLHELSARLVTEGDIQTLYQEIIAAAIALTRADAGTVQILDEATQELLLLATQGFERNMTEYFYRVNASSNTPCGIALKTDARMFVDFDVPESEDPDGSMRMHLEAGYLSAQSTPLITRSGKAIGMVSTHWCKHYRPTEHELRFLDLLGRQAADLIEQRQAQVAIAADLRDTQRLHELSTYLASEDNIQVLYNEIMAAAVDLMQADAGTIQILEEETQYILLLASQGLEQKTVEYFYRIDASSNTACGIALATRKRAIINYDVPASEDPGGSLQKLVEAGFLCGQSTPLISRSGRAIGIVSTHWRKHHRPSDRELRFLDLLARQAADLIEQRQAEAALRESEAKYRSLFNSIDEGFCIFELLFDDEGNAVDWIYLETNRAFEGQTGFVNAVGKRISELQPDMERLWFEQFARIARTGESVRLIDRTEAMDRWYDVYALRVGAAGDNRISLLFRDITDRKRREANLAFLADIETEFTRLASSSEIANVAGDRIAAHFNLSHCLLVEIDQQAKVATIFHDHKAADLPSLVGDYVIQDFHTEAEAEQLAAGQPLVINDALSERHSEENAARFEALGNRSLVTAPYLRDGRWKFALSAQDRHPRLWREDEIEFLQELAMRVSLRIERARAEAALRESEEKFRAFLSAASDIIYEMSADWREMRSLEGKEFIATTEDPRHDWIEAYIPETDKPRVRAAINRAIATRSNFELEHRVIRLDGTVGWTFSRAIPLINEAGEIVKWFGAASDITDRVEAEAALRESEAKYRSLFKSIDEGFCIFEIIYDGTPKAVDYRFLEVNQVFEQQTGLENVVGKLGSEIAPNTESYWLEAYNDVVKTGKPQRIENYNQSTGRWYQAYASRVGKAGSRQICTVFNDITDRKRREADLAFLAQIAEDSSRLASEEAIMQSIGERLATHLRLDGFAFCYIDEGRESVTIKYNWNAADVPQLVGTFRFADYVTEEFARTMRAGETWVVFDTQRDERTDAQAMAAIDVSAIINVPYHRHGEWQGYLTVTYREVREWTADEIALIVEVSNRTFPRLERARAEEDLRQSEAKYRSLFTTMAQGFCIIEKIETAAGQRSDFRYLAANPAFEHHTGMHDVVGKTIRELVPDAEQRIMNIYDEVVRTGQPQQFEEYVSALDLWMEAEVFPTQMPGQIAVLFSNVSERKRAEARLRRAAEMDAFRVKLSDALRSLSDPLEIQRVAMQTLGEHFALDRAMYAEITPDETVIVNDNYLSGRFPAFTGEFPLAAYGSIIDKARNGEPIIVTDIDAETELTETEKMNYKVIGSTAFVTIPLIKGGRWVSNLVVHQGEPRRWPTEEIAILQETAERTWAAVERARAEAALRESELQRVREQSAREQERQRAEALAELDRAKTLFFSNVSHEFRTPLTLILAPVQDALSDSVNPLTSSQREQLELAHRNSLRLLKLVNTLLDFSRIEADRLKANYEPTDLSTYTAELASVFRSAIENANLQLVVDCPPLPDPIYVDREMWEKIVLNLLSNALKFTFEGIISVSLKPVKEGAGEQGNNSSPLPLCPSAPLPLCPSAPLPLLDAPCLFVELIVSDTGVGISASELPHLFERFYQVKGVKGRSYEGSGIGLSLVQELVKRHGGAIAVTSAVDQGTTFTVTIPTGIAHLPAVSGSMGEELVIEALKLGATDYVLKRNLRRLVPCVQRALREAQEKRDRQLAEAALHQSEARLRQVAAKLPHGAVFIVDRDLRYQLAEGEALEWVGMTTENFVGKTLWEVLEPALADSYEPYYRQALNGESFTLEHNSHDRYYISHGTPLRNERGEVDAVLAMSYDISDRKQIEIALKQSEARFRLMVASAKEYAILTVDPNAIITSWSAGAEELFKYSEAEIIGRDSRSLYAREENLEDRVGWEFQTAQIRGQAENECWHIRKDGSRFWGSGFVMPLRDEADDVQGFIKIMRDVTSQRQADERFRLLYDITSDLLAVEQPMTLMHNLFSKLAPQLGLDYYYNYIVESKDNRPILHLKNYEGITQELAEAIEWIEFGESLCGWAAQERQQIVLNYIQIATDPLAEIVRNQGVTAYVSQPLIVEERLLGTISFASCTRTYFTVEEIDLLQLMSEQIAIALDRANLIVSIQQQAEQLQRANQIKDEFLAVLSHELRSPLNPILGWSQLLRKGKVNAARQREALLTIERNAKLQSQLIEDLLDISRIMRGKLSLTVAPLNLIPIISAALETVRLAAEAKNINLQIDLDPTAPISGDAARLQQVVWNLLTNAVKFTPDDGQVIIELRQIAGQAQIRVIDTGIGIQPEFLPHVFDYFRQEDSSTTRRFGGLGLGLAIVRQIVELHGGTVKAESLGENQGATFTVQIPILNQSAQIVLDSADAEASSAQTPLSNLQILVVDDDTDTREFQAFLLKQNGAKVTAVASGLEALQVLDSFIPDVIVSDVGMADMDGYMLIGQIRSRPANQGGTILAIALTAYAGDIDQQKALTAGFQAHITKPLEPEELVRKIVNLLEHN
ncbi:MAG: GAF domain-containing protein [Nostoc sp. ChiQUE02]|uniref:GAF domain-containing protein n=1 Tax=Nostoc sp. ChiQUE02 TaxID=3075377 RepID=UPI002AD43F80|nr:GAF domain-containing protein [Nostoc sp. ChiQUE02]MDZ8234776.1 GAF domain-containing protein [Nostoc sp. ChiQUE02]